MPDPVPDKELAAACARGDGEAWQRFLDRCGPTIVASVRRALGAGGAVAAADIEDCAAEVIAELLADEAALLRSFRGEARLTTWLWVIARRTAIAWRTRRARGPGSASEEALAAVRDRSEGPEDAAARRDAAAAVARAVAELPPRDREILRLFYDAGKSQAEISAAVGIPVAQVSTALFRAREKAARVLRKYPGLREP
ncbi:MAG: sigma-70 family RNA polymerase sigma factor [Planctomycetales bacterium]|nr:sigma-70 family RNA polymerase sigma factor [Planctomycetales bacterium]